MGVHPNRVVALFVLLAALWGTAFMAIKAGLADLPPVLFAAVRYDIAGVCMLAVAAVRTRYLVPRTREDVAAVGVAALLMIAGYHTLLFIGEADPGVTSAAAAVIVSLAPLVTTALAAAVIPADGVDAVGAVAVVVGLVGVVVLIDPTAATLAGGATVPKLLIVTAALSFAAGAVILRWLRAPVPIETLEAWAMLLGAGVMHLVSVGRGERWVDAVWSPTALAAVIYLAIFASAVGFLIYFALLREVGPVQINLVSYVAPVFAALAGWAVLGEVPTATTAVGFAIIVAGFALLKRRALVGLIPRG